MKRRRVTINAAVALALVACALLLARNRQPSLELGATSSETTANIDAPTTEDAPPFSTPAQPAASAAFSGRLGATIDSIEVDKREVCAGEENFVTIHAHGESGGSEWLVSRLAGTRDMGFRIPFRLERDSPKYPVVLVSGPGGPSAVGNVPQVKIKDCAVDHRVTIGVSLDARSPHLLTLTASVASIREGFSPTQYEWDFGDGSKEATSRAEVIHSYEGHPQETRYTYLLLRVTAYDSKGQSVQGSRAYGFTNLGFAPLVNERRVVVFAAGGSAPGEDSGKERVRLYHGYRTPVHIDRVLSKLVRMSDGERREEAEPEHTPREVLGLNELASGTSTETADLRKLRPKQGGLTRILELVGRADGMEARGRIVLSALASNSGS